MLSVDRDDQTSSRKEDLRRRRSLTSSQIHSALRNQENLPAQQTETTNEGSTHNHLEYQIMATQDTLHSLQALRAQILGKQILISNPNTN